MINSNFSKKILIAIFQLSSLATYALTPTEGLIEKVQPYLDTHAIFDKAHAVLIDSSWILATPDAAINNSQKQNINGIKYGILKTISLPSVDDVQYNLYYLDKPVVNVKPVARVRFLPSSELDGIIVSQYENNNVAASKKFKENKLEDSSGIEKEDVGCPVFWHSSDNENFGLIGFLNSTSTIKPLTEELNTQIDNEIIKQALAGIELIKSEEKKLEEEHSLTPPPSPKTPKSEHEEIKHEEEKSTEKKELTLPKAAGYNATLIDSSWLLTFKTDTENPLENKVRYSENKEDEVTVDKVIDDPDGSFRLLHLDQPIFDQPIKRARLAKEETPDKLFSVSKIFKKTTAGNIFYLRVNINKNEVVLTKKHSLNPAIQQFNIQDISNQHFSTGAGVFLQNPSGEFELYAVAEKKSRVYPLTKAVNTWIDNEIIKQALTPHELPEKLKEEIHQEIPTETTSSEEPKEQIKDKKEIENVLSKIQKTFNEDIYITGYPKLNEEWETLVTQKKEELDHVKTNQELAKILNEWITTLKENLDIKNYPLSIEVTQPKEPSTKTEEPQLTVYSIQTGTTGILFKTPVIVSAAVLKIPSITNTTSIKIAEYILSINKESYQNLIIDLRNSYGNPMILNGALSPILGGFFGKDKLYAIETSIIHPEGNKLQSTTLYMRTSYSQNKKTTHVTEIVELKEKLQKKLIILVNEKTSGTAEIMAQALADIGGAVIIGTHTADQVDMTGTAKITGIDHGSIWFTYPLKDFLSSKEQALQQLGGVQFRPEDILLKENTDALGVAKEYIKNPKATLEKYK